jgi:hypothetical protein
MTLVRFDTAHYPDQENQRPTGGYHTVFWGVKQSYLKTYVETVNFSTKVAGPRSLKMPDNWHRLRHQAPQFPLSR